MATLTKGHTFGATEQVTNTKLHNLVDLGTISGILSNDIANNFLSSLASSAGKVPVQNIWKVVNIATNTSFPDVSSGTHFNLYHQTYVSIASFVNTRTGQQFSLIAQQASFPAIIDTGVFKLNGNWAPAKQFDNLTLFYDGTNYIELFRTAV